MPLSRILAMIVVAGTISAPLLAHAQPSPAGCPPGNVPCVAIQAFVPTGTATISASTSSSNAALGSSGSNLNAVVHNAGAVDAIVAFGGSSVTATTPLAAGEFLVPAGKSIVAPIGTGTYIAAITASSTAALTVYTGTGAPPISGW